MRDAYIARAQSNFAFAGTSKTGRDVICELINYVLLLLLTAKHLS